MWKRNPFSPREKDRMRGNRAQQLDAGMYSPIRQLNYSGKGRGLGEGKST
jgi:hypothetical protein